MKFAKRIFAGLLVAVIAVSCLAVFSFAEAPTITPDEIENVLEYYSSEDFIVDDFEDYDEGDYVYAPICPDCGERLDYQIVTVRGAVNVYYFHNPETYTGDCHYGRECSKCGELLDYSKDAKGVYSFLHDKTAGYSGTCKAASNKGILYNNFAGACEFIRKKSYDKDGFDIDKNIVVEDENKILEIVNRQSTEIRYSVSVSGGKEKLVVSFRVKTDNLPFYDSTVNEGILEVDGRVEPEELENGSNISLWINDQDTKRKDVFSMNCNEKDNYKFSYLFYDETNPIASERFTLKTMDLQPSLNEWYTIQVVIDCTKGVYQLDVTPDGKETVSTGEMSLGTIEAYKTVNFEILDKNYAGTKTWFDDISILEGTFVRNSANKEQNTVNYILALDALLKDANTPIPQKTRIADVYAQLFGTYGYVTTDETVEKTSQEARDAIDAIIENYTHTVTDTYVNAFIGYADMIASKITYQDRVDFINGDITRFVEVFSDEKLNGDIADLETEFPGIEAEDVIKLKKARASYEQELVDIARVKTDSESFLAYVLGYDDTNTDINYMKTQLVGMNLFTYKDSTYTFEEGASELYATVADIEAVVEALADKIESISAAADTFIGYVNAMAVADDFKVLYDNYVLAKAVYNDGNIHEKLDNDTYTGINEAIATYLEREIFINEKAVESEAFITYVDRAYKSTFYTAKLDELNKAALYLDADKDVLNAEKGYPGVAEAETLYNQVKLELETNVANAEKYIGAVNAIATAETFAVKKAAVEYAMGLRADDKFTGIEGVKEANQKLYEADGEIKALEGYSETLIETVAALKASTDLEERRAYIFAAKACVDRCEKTITGVTQAISELEALTTQFNADIEAINNAFAVVMNGSGIVTSGANAN